MPSAVILRADARALPLPDGCVDLIVTSPPHFGLRSYTDGGEHYAGQLGSEATPAAYIAALVDCTREWVRVLKPEGSLFVNLGDKFSSGGRTAYDRTDLNGARGSVARPLDGAQPKSLLGLPWRYALAATDELGLILRRDIIWSKPNGLPESVRDRCRSSHEYVFHLVRQPRYFSAVDEIREPHAGPHPDRGGLNGGAYSEYRRDGALANGVSLNPLGKLPGSVWSIPSQPLVVPERVGVDHFAAFPVELPRRIVLGWSPAGVCVACGQGRRPVAEFTPEYAAHRGPGTDWNRHLRAADGYDGTGDRRIVAAYACGCPRPDAPTRPAVVLDPFMGTGTTLLAAAALGRHAIGVDLSADYCRLARWRVNDPAERARAWQVPKPPPVPDNQAALFEVTG